MFSLKNFAVICCMFAAASGFSQQQKKQVSALRINTSIIIDGLLTDTAWRNIPAANEFTCLRPTPFLKESKANASEVYFAYNDEGFYVGGYFHESTKDSIASELAGRDGFGNNDFAGIILDTYNDKLNGFEYFVTPLGEQMDAKQSPVIDGNSEDFSWNAVWQSAAKIQNDGWSFEMFIPYAAIRFGKKNVQEWGLNIVRRRQKSGQQLFWQSIDPNVNGFLTQEGTLKGLQNIQAPLRLQFTPYFSSYINADKLAAAGTNKTTTPVNGGIDVKYGINPAFTLDVTLVPDFGQALSDNRVLNLSPFEQRFSENRTFFTEGTELFSKGNLFYSRRIGRIGARPLHYDDVTVAPQEAAIKNPEQVKLINATKISGRTQSGLGIGILNAVTNTQYAVIENSITKQTRRFETEPLTNYNVFVLDQTMKNNSSISFVNTNVLRSGSDYDANVSSLLFDLNDKKNKWNVGGNVGMSALMNREGKNIIGYTHSIYFGKTSGAFNFNVWQDLVNAQYDKSDLGYFTNNNSMDHGLWMSYNWTKPTNWYNRLRVNMNVRYSRLVSPLDAVRGKDRMYQSAGWNINSNAQTKNLWSVGINLNGAPAYNDFYEPRVQGRVFHNTGRIGLNGWWESNSAKKLSWGGDVFVGKGSVLKRKSFNYSLFGKVRFNSKFSVDASVSKEGTVSQPGFAFINETGNEIIFSRRDVNSVYSAFNLKYSFTNKMGITLNTRHNWTRVTPRQFYLLNATGDLEPTALSKNADQNYNYFAADMVYTWQFAPGSFLNIVLKKIGEDFKFGEEAQQVAKKNYLHNLGSTVSGNQLNNNDLTSISVRLIYFIDYMTVKNKYKNKKGNI